MIESKDNKIFKKMKKLKTKKYRDLYDEFLVYGPHLIQKAKDSNSVIEIYTTNEAHEGTLISKELMLELNQTETVFEDLALCKKSIKKIESDKVLILEEVQDPANVGALLRSASAFGFDHVFLSHKSADIYNEKTIRASQGSIFDVYVERGNILSFIENLKQKGYTILYADAHEKKINEENIVKKALILGNEGNGISQEVKEISDYPVHIETKTVESLNVSVAGSILMYQWRD
ncbi:RNA methyltransferase, TrmH family [Alteracholeplasma palmae J233]|uniref:RNA methyltransferase, TrmH family n=1 Tax=Alteracholeplasma palmae (strain ATCC 49389 / J233) TaxID=1318466 RepID=U4KNP3_ALTPJ|nr:RNA methyltransferase [Alteracholeplasma palmae]CCV63820.1 RNA methyltransferase, TrmH family [Alteracholeplasma palmae J233]